MEVEIKGYIVAYFSKYDSPAVPHNYIFMTHKPHDPCFVVVKEHLHIAEFDVPDNWVPQRVELMRAAQAKARLEAEETVAEIEQELQKLLCLENTV